MQSLSFHPGRAFLSSDSPTVPWTAVFEDEGVAGYFYACDRSQQTQDHAILDAMLIYNVASLGDLETERLAAIQWSATGLQAVLYLDGSPQALVDFSTRTAHCRTGFPNFMPEGNSTWNRANHDWSPLAIERFESTLYR